MTGESERSIAAVVSAMAMDFVVEIVRGPDGPVADDAHAAIRSFHSDLLWADEVFSLWIPDSPLSRLSRGEIGIDDCPPAVAEVVAECERYRIETDGYFDARSPEGVVDPTGIVKAWAVTRATWRFDALGPAGWMVGASGDVVAAGTAADGAPWPIGIGDPRRPDDPQGSPILDVVPLGDGLDAGYRALATSGTAQHGEHIWNPRTGARRAAYRQVSVVGGDLVECDAWATAIVAGGAEIARAAQRRGLEVLCIPPGGSDDEDSVAAEVSPGWPGIAS